MVFELLLIFFSLQDLNKNSPFSCQASQAEMTTCMFIYIIYVVILLIKENEFGVGRHGLRS